MADTNPIVINFSTMQNGRNKILTNRRLNGIIENDKKIIPMIIAESMPFHLANVADSDYLFNYYYNKTDIRDKTKKSRTDINNKISIPDAKKICTTIESYCFSSPFKYVSREAEKVDIVKKYNDSLIADDSYGKFAKTTWNSSICGLGYRYVTKPTPSEIENGYFFKTETDIDPRNAFCVYSNDISKEKIMGVIYYYDKKEKQVGNQKIEVNVTVYNVFTKWHTWVFEYNKIDNRYYNIKFPFFSKAFPELTELDAFPYELSITNGKPIAKTIPLLEYVRQPDRTGDFELAISLMNAIYIIISNTVDVSSENADFIFLFKDVDIGEWDENNVNPTLEDIKRAMAEHILSIKGNPETQNQPSVDILHINLNMSEVKSLLEFLYSKLEEVTFIPNRNSSNGGADTNSSVETRNGFRSLEDIAGVVTKSVISTEREFIQCTLEIAKNIPNCPFKDLYAKDIEIKPMRNKVESIINQTQAFATMINAGVNRVTAYVVSGLVADPTDTAKMDELERDSLFQETLRQELIRLSKTNNVSNTENNTSVEDKVDEPKTE